MKSAIVADKSNAALLGALLVFTGAVCFSAKAVMVKLAYRYGIDASAMLGLRMLFSLPFFLGFAWYSSRKAGAQLSPKDLRLLLAMGVLGYYLASLFDFMGLQYITAGMERLILFIYPTLVVLLSALVLRKPIKRIQVWALVITYGGIGLAVSDNAILEGNQDFALGAGLIFLSALTYAIYLIGSGELIPRLGTVRFTAYAMVIACVAVLIHTWIAKGTIIGDYPREVYVLGILMATASTVLPTFLYSEGVRLVGASNAAIVGSIGPVSTIVLAYFFLGEEINLMEVLGTILVIGGVLLISLKK